jgi:hypothetical protein
MMMAHVKEDEEEADHKFKFIEGKCSNYEDVTLEP